MKKNIVNIIVLLISIAVADIVIGCFLVPIIILKITGIDIDQHQKIHTSHPYYNHGFNPNQTAKRKFGDITYLIHTNSLGMIDAYPRIIDPSKKNNIVFIGDSYTEGVGVPFDKTFFGILQQQIGTTHTNMLNAGVASFSPKLYFLRVKYLIEIQKVIPSVIYCLPDFSDYGDELVYEDFKPNQSFLPIKIVRFLSDKSVIYNFYHWLLRKSFLYRLGVQEDNTASFIYSVKTNNDFIKRYPDFLEIREHWVENDNMGKPTFKKARQLAEANMDSLQNLCWKYQIELNVIGYPRKNYGTLDSVRVDEVESLWKDYCSSRNINYISLFKMILPLSAEDVYLQDGSHWNEKGHEIVAKILLPHCSNQLK